MSHKTFIAKRKYPSVLLGHYLPNLREPTDVLCRDTTRALEYQLLEDSKPMKRRFRRLASDIRIQYAQRKRYLESATNDRYLQKFGKRERLRIISQFADMQRAEDEELSKVDSFVAKQKQRVNFEREKKGLSPL